MALTIDFSIDEDLMKVLHAMKSDPKIRSCFAIIESERIKLYKEPLPSTDDLDNDMGDIRRIIVADKIEACFVVIRIDDKNFGHITFSPDGVKPKLRMMYAASSAHLRSKCGLAIGADDHISDFTDINASLYNRDKTDALRKEMMTENEKEHAAVAKLAPAPAPVAMAGVTCPLTDKAVEAAEAFKKEELKAAVFVIGGNTIDVEKTFPKDATLAAIVKDIPENQPRYIVISYESHSWLVYVCPPGAKPKDRMPYASSKASFISQINDKVSLDLVKRVEIDEAKEMEEAMKYHLKANDLPENVAPVAPKSLMPKGPRMLM